MGGSLGRLAGFDIHLQDGSLIQLLAVLRRRVRLEHLKNYRCRYTNAFG
jgi:hypothetical protein